MKAPEKVDYCFFALNRNWNFTFVNHRAAEWFDSRPGLIVGKNIWQDSPFTFSEYYHTVCNNALTTQEPVFFEDQYDAHRWLEYRVYPSRNGLSIYARDISEIKAIRKELRQSQAHLAATLNNTDILIWSVDRDLRLITFNRPLDRFVRQWYGVNLKIGDNVLEKIFLKTDKDKFTKWSLCMKRVLLGAKVIMEEKSFGFNFDCSISPIKEGSNIIGATVFVYNTTDKKKNETDLAKANKEIGHLKLMALRAAMNSHFIFSTLNSIQYYIIENDTLNAVSYLSAFSRLMRGTLENSINNTIRLSDELEMLRLYVRLELMRLENQFDFEIEIDSYLNVNAIEIPTMLIQPFVENAIRHGLSNKIDRGALHIRVKQENFKLLIEIDDDGIGREAAMNLTKYGEHQHRSLATKVTRERIKLLNGIDDAAFEIIDKEDGGKAQGTLVKIWLKLT